jgi:hypothetical protein
MNLKSFGCSFIFGTDLADNRFDDEYPVASQLTWPALIAQKMGWQYHCYAHGGSGNLQILHKVLAQAALSSTDDFFVIGWTFQERFDFVDRDETRWPAWQTLRPSLDHPHAQAYFRDLHSHYRDKFTTLVYMYTAIEMMQNRKIPFVMTTVDESPFDTDWHATPAVSLLQDSVYRDMTWFEQKNFLTWCQEKGFPISKTLHPLELAHEQAANIILPMVEKKINLFSS